MLRSSLNSEMGTSLLSGLIAGYKGQSLMDNAPPLFAMQRDRELRSREQSHKLYKMTFGFGTSQAP